MENPITYYQTIKNEQHVFLYCVAGRSSSTAFQRIINSSNNVWLWGEQHSIIDDTVSLINKMEWLRDTDFVKSSLMRMHDSFKNNNHLLFYPNAIGNLDDTIDIISCSISNMLKPGKSTINRFGFKDINITDIKTLIYLKSIYPQSFFIFCFRNPLSQWPSVKKFGAWVHSKNLELFLAEYARLSTIYLEFSSAHAITAFVENDDLKVDHKVLRIIEYLNIPKIDSKLINVTVSTVNYSEILESDRKVILNSLAYNNYLQMKNISNFFYKI